MPISTRRIVLSVGVALALFALLGPLLAGGTQGTTDAPPAPQTATQEQQRTTWPALVNPVPEISPAVVCIGGTFGRWDACTWTYPNGATVTVRYAVAEDDPAWSCATMGNRQCAPAGQRVA
jgi:hypothetical protein